MCFLAFQINISITSPCKIWTLAASHGDYSCRMVSSDPELTTNRWELASEKADISWANSWRKFFAISLIPTFFFVEIFNICDFRKAAVRKSAFLNQSGAICCVSVCSGSMLPGWRKGFLSGPLSICFCTSILACLSKTSEELCLRVTGATETHKNCWKIEN